MKTLKTDTREKAERHARDRIPAKVKDAEVVVKPIEGTVTVFRGGELVRDEQGKYIVEGFRGDLDQAQLKR